MHKTLAAALLIVLLVVGGCVTTGPQTPSTGYNYFYTPGDNLSKLVEQKQYSEAEQVYEREAAFFAQNPDKYRESVESLASALNSTLAPEIDALVSELSQITWPAPFESWSSIANLLANCDEVLRRYDSKLILKNTGRRLPSIDELRQKKDQIQNVILQDAPKEFAQFSQTCSVDFFEKYPVKLDARSFFSQNSELLLNKLTTADKGEIEQAFKIYGNYLQQNTCERFGPLFYRAALREQGAVARPTFHQIVEAAEQTCTSKMGLKAIPDCTIKVIDSTSSNLLRKGEAEFPAAINVDLPIPMQKMSLDNALSSPDFRSSQVLIVIDTQLAKSSREIVKRDAVSSEFQSGSRTEPNPDYNMAQNMVNIARQELMQTQLQKISIDNQYCYGLACAGKLVAQIAAIKALNQKTEDLNQSMVRLSQTPMTIEVPVYTPYQFYRAAIKAFKTMTVNCHIILSV